MRGGRAAEIVAILILAFGTWLGFAASGLPDVVPASAVATAFSAERATTDLQFITATPHATGSAAHDRVRDYLVDRLRALGLTDVHVQSATGFNTLQGPLAATVANVVGRKHGTTPGPALLLSAHYDAVPRSPGAGDDGAGVAAILETVRALVSGPPLDHDLIVVFNDAEEDGLLGAEAFVNLHPWARDVGMVLNFDGRGNAGPVYMYQTSPGNAALIRAVAHVDGARTNSLTGEVYRHLPSDTDLSIWLHSGFAVGALNFAHVGGYASYHTPMDNIASLDLRIVQQMGAYALSLARTLGMADFSALRTTDAIYFNAPFVGVVRYPARWAIIVGIDALVLVLLLIGHGWYRRTITWRGLGRGTLVLLVTLVLPTLVTFAGWRLIRLVHPDFREILQGDPYNALWYLLAACAFTVAVAVTAQKRLGSTTPAVTAMELAIAPMLLWGVLGLVVAVLLPGASYLFAWPLFAVTMCASWWRRDAERGKTPPAWLALFALPALVLWAPLVMSLEIALTADMLPFCALLLGMMLSLLVMPLQLAGALRRWLVLAAAVISVGALIRAEVSASFSEVRKRPDSLSYLVDTDSAKAWWVSFDRTPDAWTGHALGDHPGRRTFPAFGITSGANGLLATAAGSPSRRISPVHLLVNESSERGHRVHLHIDRSGPGEVLSVIADSTIAISQVTINGRVLPDGMGDRYAPQYHLGPMGDVLRYFGVPEEGIDLWFTVAASGPVALRVVSSVEGLPPTAAGPLPPRPVEITSKPFVRTDMTIVGWTIQL